MPSRNTVRLDSPDSYYHVYARGASKQTIFLDPNDFNYFLHLLARYLSRKPAESKTGIVYPHYYDKIELVSYCLMGNHFHLLVYQREKGVLSQFMKSLMTSYSRYFNFKYNRSGPMFENRYKSSLITNDSYLMHISRYIHLNPRSWKRYPYSSIGYYRSGGEPEWLQTSRALDQHNTRQDYINFVSDYEQHKEMLEQIKAELADS